MTIYLFIIINMQYNSRGGNITQVFQLVNSIIVLKVAEST